MENCFNHNDHFANNSTVFMSSQKFKDKEGSNNTEEEEGDLKQG